MRYNGGLVILTSTVANKNIASWWWQNGVASNQAFNVPPGPLASIGNAYIFPEQCQIHLFHFNIYDFGGSAPDPIIQLRINNAPLVDEKVPAGNRIQDHFQNPPIGFTIWLTNTWEYRTSSNVINTG